jgi:hypothetical protein
MIRSTGRRTQKKRSAKRPGREQAAPAHVEKTVTKRRAQPVSVANVYFLESGCEFSIAFEASLVQ